MSQISETLDYEIHSALFWSERLGGYGNEMARRANRFALMSAAVSALTGAAVWTTLKESDGVMAQVAVTAMAIVAAVLAMWPSTAGYAECSKQSTSLANDYAQVLIKLRKASDHLHSRRRSMVLPKQLGAEVDEAIAEFQQIRARKEALRPYPDALEKEVRSLRDAVGSGRTPSQLAELRTVSSAQHEL